MTEQEIELKLIEKLRDLKYAHRPGISDRTETWYFANNNARHFAFNAEERFLPIYQFASEDNNRIIHLEDFADKFLAKCTLGHMQKEQASFLVTVSAVGFMASMLRLLPKVQCLVEVALISPKQQGSFA